MYKNIFYIFFIMILQNHKIIKSFFIMNLQNMQIIFAISNNINYGKVDTRINSRIVPELIEN